MFDKFDKEQDFENALITMLFDKGWEPEVLKYKTEEDLIQNWANILFENNRDIDRLNDTPLTDGEMGQILEQIKTLRTPLRLNGFINGKTVTIKRDNPADPIHLGKEVSLKIYDRREIAAGSSRYQIAEQPKFKAKSALLNDRRGDFMLLINGMPVIHVELKRSGVPVSQACYQIEKYAHENVFTGLFSLVQLFVAMNPDEAVYYANPGPDGKFNSDYYFHWEDYNNELVNDWQGIASQLLSIPMAHMMIGFYTVADDTDGILKVMRSYQYYAASAISDRVARRKWDEKDQRGGYIWHTTGSGKTLTSFKSAQLIANSGDADKVVFLMDRVELGTQSLQDYRGFAEDSDSVQETENTGVLIATLKSDNPADTLIVTSIQKMSRVSEEKGRNAHDIEAIEKKRIVFIIDEAHRDVFGEMLHTIKETFPNAMFFGFTGTPIHEENAKVATTSDVFGNELHRYSIADGIRDKNVLGFDPYMVTTYSDSDLRKAVALEMAKAKDEAEVFTDPKKTEIYYKYMDHTKVPMTGYLLPNGEFQTGIENHLNKSQYDRPEHRKAVVEDILAKWTILSHNGKFHAILATSSIPEAIEYYKIFKAEKPEFHVVALFDENIDNTGGAIPKEDAIVEMLTDYNTRFGTSFKMATYASYKKDISLRLAHKKPYMGIENEPEKQVQLLIVVDQMLTGFDSKWINTLYLDKLLRQERLIQAFSRTNRLFDPVEKPFGIIRYYRYPHTMERNINIAFKNYSGDKPLGMFADKLEKNLTKLNDTFTDINDLFTSAGITNFEKLPDDKIERAKFAKLFNNLNEYLAAAMVQNFTWKELTYKFANDDGTVRTVTLLFDETTYLILVLRYKELFGGGGSGGGDDVPYDIDTHITEINTGAIDTDYMNSRFTKYIKALQDGADTESILNELHKSFATLTQEEQKYANIFLHDVESGRVVVDGTKTLRDYITDYCAKAKNDQIHRFAEEIGVDEKMLRDFMNRHVTIDNINEFGLFDQLKNSVDRAKAKAYFEKVEGKPISTIRVSAKLDSLLTRFILEGGFDIGA